ncbi:MAG: 2-phospho-L-lactate transferase [Phototrophicales bacterium]|nr:MAG: 2-phospho-L-lactate transferase [Phototrophicales bacterium]
MSLKVVALTGGVGGAKLAYGLSQVLPPHTLTVIGNVGDDFEYYGLHISPDLDTVMYTLAGIVNPITGWGQNNETWQMKTMLQTYGEDVWFGLGDRDLATHILRTDWLRRGYRLTEITLHLAEQLQIPHTILPATDDRLRTMVQTVEYGLLPFQEYFVKHRWQPIVSDVSYDGAETAKVSPEVLEAIQQADLIIICPSNPILSIAPILAVQSMRELLMSRSVPTVLVSPLIGGKAIKGPTDKIMRELGYIPSTIGVVQFYEGLLDYLIIDVADASELKTVQELYPKLQILQTSTLMQTIDDRISLAQYVLACLENEEIR